MRFKFGKNWESFSRSALTADSVEQAREHFKLLLQGVELKDRTFLDVGFGQGLGVLIAAEMGAIASGIDIDQDNLRAFEATKLFFDNSLVPTLEIESILSETFLQKCKERGGFDIVYSWGVLHHTGAMHQALQNCAALVKPGGHLIISIYNTHWSSPVWSIIKRCYNLSPSPLQKLMTLCLYPVIAIAKAIVTGKSPFLKERGMNFYYEVIDWIGGYPYEHASVEEIRHFFHERGFKQVRTLNAEVPTGCNEFVFRRIS